ncbi:50S ribosomal protein L16 [Candidatus Woesearchaeota archaeon]|nr:50S ribosomal protein L16 [Candidatus Woesearchaeota archaeon]
MARLRKFVAYRSLERPYTRLSKYKKKSFIRTTANIKIVKFKTGNLKKKFPYSLNLISKGCLQIRDNALESGRQTCNRLLETTLGPSRYSMQLRKYPFHILRENPLAAGAGADRFSTGMQKSFGKPIGSAIRVKKGEKIVSISVSKQNIGTAKKGLERFRKKIPGSYLIEVENVATQD